MLAPECSELPSRVIFTGLALGKGHHQNGEASWHGQSDQTVKRGAWPHALEQVATAAGTEPSASAAPKRTASAGSQWTTGCAGLRLSL